MMVANDSRKPESGWSAELFSLNILSCRGTSVKYDESSFN